jgi:hypothetical protein
MPTGTEATHAEPERWKAARPRFGPLRLVPALIVGAVAVVVSGLILPGVEVKTFLGIGVNVAGRPRRVADGVQRVRRSVRRRA